MGDIFGAPEKANLKTRLFEIGVSTLETKGYVVERVPGLGKSSVRKVTKDGKSQLVAIRTTQDRYISFPRDKAGKSWKTLSDVELVVPVSVDDKENPKCALVHMIDAKDMIARFDRAYAARKAAGQQSLGSYALWLSLYHPESNTDPRLVGAGAGIVHPPFAKVSLNGGTPRLRATPAQLQPASNNPYTDESLSFAEAKRRLALTLGVDPSAIKISVEA